MPKNWGFAALLALVALLLTLSLVKYGTDRTVVYVDGHVTSTIPGSSILPAGERIEDAACISGAPCKVKAIAETSGFYPRANVNWWIAVIAGLVIPYLFVCTAGFLVLRSIRGWAARILAGLTLLPGLMLLLFIGYGVSRAILVYQAPISAIIREFSASVTLVVVIVGLTLTVTGTWLSIRAVRSGNKAA